MFQQRLLLTNSMMQQPANSQIASEVAEYLRRCGVPERKLRYLNASTQLFRDLDVYGDVAEAFMEELRDGHAVNMENFRFEDYFPEEFVGDSLAQKILYWILPVLGRRRRRIGPYRPITLKMLDQAIRDRTWSSVVDDSTESQFS